MTLPNDRITRFEGRQQELSQLSDEELKARFWQLCDDVVQPIVELARTHTSPSIERSVLLRMGIDSLSAHGVVDAVLEAGLLGKGAGHVLVKLSEKLGVDLQTTAAKILEDHSLLNDLF